MRPRILVLVALTIFAGAALAEVAVPTASAAECVTIISPDPQIQPINPCAVVCRLSHEPCIE